MCVLVGLYVDPEYKTMLGVSFYDRLREVDRLDELTRGYRVTIVYGPRNVGKSELVYYWIRRRATGRVVVFEADRMRASTSIKGIARYLNAPEDAKRTLLRRLTELVLDRLNLLDVVLLVYEFLEGIGGEVVVFLDEFHLLPKYRAIGYEDRGGEALADLEALAHRLAKEPRNSVRVVLTVSEGFIATGDVMARLHGYSSEYMLVEHMDSRHFKALYDEYAHKAGCNTSYDTVYNVVGGTPGYLDELCRGEEAVANFITRSKNLLENSLSNIRSTLDNLTLKEAKQLSDPIQLLRLIYEILSSKGIKPVEEPLPYTLGQLLTIHNIAYPLYKNGTITFKPQIPIYRILLEIGVEKRLKSILEVNTKNIIQAIKHRG